VKNDDRLQQEALELPRAIEPPRDLWVGVEARIRAKRRRTTLARRSLAGATMLLAAAAVLLSIRAPKPGPVADRTPPITSEALTVVPPPSSTDEVSPDEVAPEEAAYLAALAALESTLEEREKELPAKDALAANAGIRALDTAIAVTRAALFENPGDADLRAELDAEYEQKIDAMNDVLAWTTRS
jgi:hypothetical protein